MSKKFFLLISICIVLATGLIAKNAKIEFERISTKQGLSQSSVTSIVQDSIGFLWFGTYDGLNRYDGYEYKIYRHHPHNPNSISHNHIRALLVDRKGNLWIGTVGGGLNFFDQEKEIFLSFKYDPVDSNSISHNSIRNLLLDKKNNLWISTYLAGINRLSLSDFYNINKKDISFEHFQNTNVGVSNNKWNRITGLYQDQHDNIWIGTRYGLTMFNPVSEEFTNYFSNPEDPYSLIDNNISAICEDKMGNLWISNWQGGINKYINQKGRFIRYPYKRNNIHSPSNNLIMNLYNDFSNDLWIATWGSGINKLVNSKKAKVSDYNNSNDKFIHYNDNPQDINSIHNLSIYSFCEDKSGVLWIGSDWNGLYKNVKTPAKFQHYYGGNNQLNSQSQKMVFNLQKDKSGLLWIATQQMGLNIFDMKNNHSQYYMNNPRDPSTINHNKIRTIFKDRKGRIWIGTEIGLDEFDYKNKKFIHYTLDPDDSYSSNIFSIIDDRYGNLWIGTYGRGLYKLNTNSYKINHYTYNAENPNSIGDDIIWKMHEDRKGNLWIGTDNGGLNIYDPENDHFIRYINDPENQKSISGNKILTIFEEKSGQLWFGTTNGLNKLDNQDSIESQLSFIHYSIYDGLPTNTIHAILEDDHGNLWISTNNGLSSFNPLTEEFINFNESDGLQDKEFNVNSSFKDTLTGELYFGGINGFNVFHPDSIQYNKKIPDVVLTDFKILNKSISVNEEIENRVIFHKSLLNTDEITLSHKDIIFSITFSALHFISPENNKFSYILEGFEKKWNYVDADQRVATYTNLDPGEYIFRVRASNNDRIWNEKGISLKINILPPFWMTAWFRILSVLLIIALSIWGYKYRMDRIKKVNRELEQHVQARTDQLKQSNKDLESFTYSVSHDLRAPLRAMNGFSNALMEDNFEHLNDQGKDYLRRIQSASSQMGNLIDELLKLSRISKSKLRLEKVNLSEMVLSILNGLKQNNPDRKTNFIISPMLRANADKGLIEIMFKNLLGNAWKFTSKQSISEIKFGETSYDNEKVFYIKDNGIGFDMKYVNKLFEPFQRQNKYYEGTGIGLTIANRIINRHGGKIWAEGKIDKGATFYFKI